MQNLKNSEKKQNGPILNRMAWMMAPGKLELIESPLPELAVDEVLVKIKASAICGSDLHLFNGKHPSVKLPTAVGHECAGVVVELGAYARGFQLGDKVTIEPNINCGYCEACLHGDYGYCENINFTYRIGRGALADYIAVRQDKVFKLPESMPFAEGALIEPLAVATHAVRRAEIQMGEEVLVIGAGAIGIFVAALCKLHGAGSVVISDRSTERLETALRLGATGKLSSRDLDEHLSQAKSKRFDKVFEVLVLNKHLVRPCGQPNATALSPCWAFLSKAKPPYPPRSLLPMKSVCKVRKVIAGIFPLPFRWRKNLTLRPWSPTNFHYRRFKRPLILRLTGIAIR
jgi:threonine dehydrogenase-like Zn-dependent dehydrogenase